MIILASDTSTQEGSVALRGSDGGIISEHLDGSRPHSETLLPAVQTLLGRANITRGDVEALAVGTGPGTFTGLRVGLATFKGWAAAAGIPLVPVVSLDSVALPILRKGTPVAVLADARKGEVFAASYPSMDRHGLPEREGDILLLEHQAVPGWLASLGHGEGALAGTGLPRLREKGLLASMDPGSGEGDAPDAFWILAMAEVLVELGRAVEPSELVPVYVRPPDAKKPGPGKIVTL